MVLEQTLGAVILNSPGWLPLLTSGSQYRSPTEGHHIGDQIDAAFIFARADFVNVRRALRVVGACEFK